MEGLVFKGKGSDKPRIWVVANKQKYLAQKHPAEGWYDLIISITQRIMTEAKPRENLLHPIWYGDLYCLSEESSEFMPTTPLPEDAIRTYEYVTEVS